MRKKKATAVAITLLGVFLTCSWTAAQAQTSPTNYIDILYVQDATGVTGTFSGTVPYASSTSNNNTVPNWSSGAYADVGPGGYLGAGGVLRVFKATFSWSGSYSPTTASYVNPTKFEDPDSVSGPLIYIEPPTNIKSGVLHFGHTDDSSVSVGSSFTSTIRWNGKTLADLGMVPTPKTPFTFDPDNVTLDTIGLTFEARLPGEPASCTGFFQPVDMNGVVNIAQAGRGIPFKWRCLEGTTPVSDSSRIGLSQQQYSCNASPSTVDDIESYTTGASGLIYEGNGYWHFNWQTQKIYANLCSDVTMKVDNVAKLTAKFKFKK